MFIKLSCNSLPDKTYMCQTIFFNHQGFPIVCFTRHLVCLFYWANLPSGRSMNRTQVLCEVLHPTLSRKTREIDHNTGNYMRRFVTPTQSWCKSHTHYDVKGLWKSKLKFHCPGKPCQISLESHKTSLLSKYPFKFSWRPNNQTIAQVLTVPTTISQNKNMGGLDLNDKARNYYAVGCKLWKWWHYLLWFLVHVGILNAHILENEAENHRFRLQL